MNRNPDRTPLTNEQLENMALACGVTRQEMIERKAAEHNENLWRSFLVQKTAKLRFAMDCLVLDTSEPFVPAERPPMVIDPFFLVQSKTGACR